MWVEEGSKQGGGGGVEERREPLGKMQLIPVIHFGVQNGGLISFSLFFFNSFITGANFIVRL